MPGQGGTNEMFAGNLVESLEGAERERLHIAYYVGKDQDHPIHHNFKARSCHVKLLIADGHIGIQGSGNQGYAELVRLHSSSSALTCLFSLLRATDAPHRYHSQEINILLDSADICRNWREGIERNQNTAKFGRAGLNDGVWRDPTSGKEAEGSMGRPGKVEGWLKGTQGMLKKMSDKGGF